MQDDLERLIEQSLDRRSSDLSIGDGSIDDVLSRVDGRGRRRRTTAVVGSLAIVTVGLVGITSLQGRDAPSGTPFDAAPNTAPATILVEGYQDAYRCTTPLDVTTAPDDGGQYFAVCDSVLLNDGVPVEVVPTTMVDGTLPLIGTCEEVTSDGVLVTIPCPPATMLVTPTTFAPPDVDTLPPATTNPPIGVPVAGNLPPLEDSDTAGDPAVGMPAPALTHVEASGSTVSVAPAPDGPTMVLFVAHWCPHCAAEIQKLSDLTAAGELPEWLDIVAVSTAVNAEQPNYPPDQWLDGLAWTWPVVNDLVRNDQTWADATAYGVDAFPFAVLVDADGIVTARWSGELDPDEILARIETYLP